MPALLGLLLVASIDGAAALRDASALAALGPHPWGSTRNEAAAQYVAAQMRAVGLSQVELQRFERHGVQGTNVVGVLPAPGEEMVVIGAHHDSVAGGPGAYDDAGGVGVLLEVARALAQEGSRSRTLVFASFDGEEAWETGKGQTAGSRAFLERLGPRARGVVAMLAIEMSGWPGGTPVAHPIAYADPRTPGATVITPGWLVEAALAGSRAAGQPLRLGDPRLSWLYQPTVRAFRVQLYGDDLSFAQAGLPALMLSDSSFSAFYPEYHKPGDVAERLDAAALARMGQATLGVARALERARGPAAEPAWFAGLGHVVGWPWLLGLGALSLLPGLRAGFAAGTGSLLLRALQAAAFAVLLWTDPVVALWVFLLPHLLLPFTRRWWALLLAAAPLVALIALGLAAWWREAVSGVWLAPWQLVVAALAFVLAFLGLGGGAAPARGRKPPAARGKKAPGLPKRGR